MKQDWLNSSRLKVQTAVILYGLVNRCPYIWCELEWVMPGDKESIISMFVYVLEVENNPDLKNKKLEMFQGW